MTLEVEEARREMVEWQHRDKITDVRRRLVALIGEARGSTTGYLRCRVGCRGVDVDEALRITILVGEAHAVGADGRPWSGKRGAVARWFPGKGRRRV